MIRTIKATIDTKGNIHLSEQVKLSSSCRVLVTILEEEPLIHINEEALLSEASLSEDWNRPEEDKAWDHLQKAQ